MILIGLLFADYGDALEKRLHRMSVIQWSISYIGILGGGGAGGTWRQAATGFVVSICPISRPSGSLDYWYMCCIAVPRHSIVS